LLGSSNRGDNGNQGMKHQNSIILLFVIPKSWQKTGPVYTK
jgi:hypothetical protein